MRLALFRVTVGAYRLDTLRYGKSYYEYTGGVLQNQAQGSVADSCSGAYVWRAIRNKWPCR
jgi:hypothetical protein